MNQESMEELVRLVIRMREIVNDDPSMPIWIGSAVSLFEAFVKEQIIANIQRVREAGG